MSKKVIAIVAITALVVSGIIYMIHDEYYLGFFDEDDIYNTVDKNHLFSKRTEKK